ncbi:hypothetical protein E2C01_075576 [Portunus trituberculatus]|uniref:Uncharacterized protein n=1 Tax=Portunus trituberculatus TaxID=210409 RepID=A0A5B7IG59_PORTR|nr:hypothetical protein [Portunus trituberculatus]
MDLFPTVVTGAVVFSLTRHGLCAVVVLGCCGGGGVVGGMEVVRMLCCPCRWLLPSCVRDSEKHELRRRLYRHRRRRTALQRLEERREEARREEERERQRVRERALLHQQFCHLYRSERLTSNSADDTSVTCSSRSSLPPNSQCASNDTHLQDSSPEAGPAVLLLQQAECHGAEESETGDTAGCQQEREARLPPPPRWVSCLPRVEEEATDEGEGEEPSGTVRPAPAPRPLSLLATTPDSTKYLHLKAAGQRFSLMSYSDWLREGTKGTSPTSLTYSLAAGVLRRVRSEPRLPQAGSRHDSLPPGTPSGCCGREGKEDGVRRERKRSGGRRNGESSAGSSRSRQSSANTSRHPQQPRHARSRPTRSRSNRRRSRRVDRASSRRDQGSDARVGPGLTDLLWCQTAYRLWWWWWWWWCSCC